MTDRWVELVAEKAGYEAVAFELSEARRRKEDGLLTEAVMRLGRATEAALYAVARELKVDLRLQIPQLASLQTALKGHEMRILKSRGTDDVKKLADLSKVLAQAIAALMEDVKGRRGESGERARGNDNILGELIEVVGEESSKRRLAQTKPLLQKIMKERNAGAHACPDGNRRETSAEVFPGLAEEFVEFIGTLLEVAIGERSRREFSTDAP